MLNRRGLVSAGAALAAGSTITGPMHDWLHTDPVLAADAPRIDDPLDADPAGFDRYEAAPIGSEEIEALERSVEVFRAWDASRGGGLQRKAVVGQLNEVGGMLSYRHPDHLQQQALGCCRQPRRTRRMDVPRHRPRTHRPEVLRHRRPCGTRGRRPPARGRGALPGGPSDGPPGPSRRRAGPDEARQVRFRGHGAASHPGDAAHHRGLGAGVHGPRPGHAPYARQGRGALRVGQGRCAAAQLDAAVRRGGSARHAGSGVPYARRARSVGGHHRAAPRQAGPGTARQRAPALQDLRLHLARLGMLHRRRPGAGRPIRAARPGDDGGDLLTPDLGPTAPDVPAHRTVRRVREDRGPA